MIACEVIGRKKMLFPGFLVLKMVFSAALLFHQTPFLLSIMGPSCEPVRVIQIGEVNIVIKNSWMNIIFLKKVDVLLSSRQMQITSSQVDLGRRQLQDL